MSSRKTLLIHGIRGIPAAHGGFESFAQMLAPYLVEQGWDVTVYCQESGTGARYEDSWKGVRLIHIPVPSDGTKGSIIFDWLTVMDALKREGLNLTLGYNTAIYSLLFRLKRKTNLFNMDGIEWKRKKWSKPIKAWFFLNECLGSWLGNHLIADHPYISKHLQARVSEKKITVIPYGANRIDEADGTILESYGLEPNRYCLLVARPEPENSVREIVSAFSRRKRGYPLVVLGNYSSIKNAYQKHVIKAASDEVKFLGAIYEQQIVNSLRFHTRLYIHGHQVGGTNPSLVETLGAGSPVLAHDNHFNRWVAGDGAAYFREEEDCAIQLDRLDTSDAPIEAMRRASRQRHTDEFSWDKVLASYHELLSDWHDRRYY
jgi:glycosyltransferase involved in cell wall biosynthesis